jgi:Trk K+ transport system NAD-binding subunit
VDFDPGVLKKWQSRGIPVLYSDITDPEIQELLPLNKVNWIVSTIRSKKLNMVLLQHLKDSGFKGRIVITASDEKEAAFFEKKGAFIIFRPFIDAAEQAADSLTYAMDFLPENVNWPVMFLEIKILPDASVAGKKIRNLPLKNLHGVTILAVNRSGRITYDPGPDLRIFPGDRLIIVGPPEILKEAETLLNYHEEKDAVDDADKFEIAELHIGKDSEYADQSLADIQFRQKFGVTVIGIRRGEVQITAVNPSDKIMSDDYLIVIGTSVRIKKIMSHNSI